VIDEDQKEGYATEKIEPNVARRRDDAGRYLAAPANDKEPDKLFRRFGEWSKIRCDGRRLEGGAYRGSAAARRTLVWAAELYLTGDRRFASRQGAAPLNCL
jgi:hypothetical protein